MPLEIDGETIITAHASKTSKINLILFEAHTSVLLPLMALPAFLFTLTISTTLFKMLVYTCLIMVVVLIILERRGITLATGLKRLRARTVSRNRHTTSVGRFKRRLKLNGYRNR